MFGKGRQVVTVMILIAHNSNGNKITPSNDIGINITWQEKENWVTTERLSAQLS